MRRGKARGTSVGKTKKTFHRSKRVAARSHRKG